MSQKSLDLRLLLSPLTSVEETRAILARTPRRNAYPRFTRIVREPSTARAHDVRYQIYIPPAGSVAWTLLGHRVIR